MNEREKFILRAALVYAKANLNDLNEAFNIDWVYAKANLNDLNEASPWCTIQVNGEHGAAISEQEVEQLMFALQDLK